MHWYELKDPVAALLGLSHDAVHVVLGGVVLAFLLVLLRPKPKAADFAWLVVLGLEVLDEAGDATDWIGWTGAVNWHETAKDFLLTMLIPTAALLLSHMLGRRQASVRQS